MLSELHEVRAYQVEVDSKMFNVEVQLLENTEEYVHVMVSVDDGRFPAFISPLSRTFIRERKPPAD